MTFEVPARVQNDECADAGDQDREQQPQTIEVERQRQSERWRPRQLDQAPGSGDRSPISLPRDTASRAGQAASMPARRGNRLTNHAARIATTNGERMRADH